MMNQTMLVVLKPRTVRVERMISLTRDEPEPKRKKP